ncbi:MAG: response regulator, partial [Phycisphaerae bacterium]|nr:response regulator [Phycisphaerae bacterium]
MDTIINTTRTARKVMIVEDNATVAQDCCDSLESLGYTVTAIIASAEESIERVDLDRPDAVLMDIHLRDAMDGVEASEKIYSQFGIPVVFLSAYSDRELLMRAKHAGAFGYLVKPFNERELYATLEMTFYRVKAEAEREKMIQQLEAKSAELERY